MSKLPSTRVPDTVVVSPVSVPTVNAAVEDADDDIIISQSSDDLDFLLVCT